MLHNEARSSSCEVTQSVLAIKVMNTLPESFCFSILTVSPILVPETLRPAEICISWVRSQLQMPYGK